MQNNTDKERSEGQAEAKPEAIKLGLDLVGPARTAGYRVPPTRWLNGQAGAEVGAVEVVGSSRRVGQIGDQGLQLLRSRGVWILVSPGIDQTRCGQLRGGTPAPGEPIRQTPKDRPIGCAHTFG